MTPKKMHRSFNSDSPLALWEFTVSGTAFLWHQVRAMAAILFLVGQRHEEPSIVARLLDVEAQPRRPVYDIASEAPLLLYNIGYDVGGGADIPWVYSAATLAGVSQLWADTQAASLLKATSLHTMRASLLGCAVRPLHTAKPAPASPGGPPPTAPPPPPCSCHAWPRTVRAQHRARP